MGKKETIPDQDTGETQKPASWFDSTPIPSGSDLPTDTVTFLFTDIEGSTTHWKPHPDLMEEALKLHINPSDGGGLISTTAGYTRFYQLMVNTVSWMGCSSWDARRSIGTYGRSGAANTNFWIKPEEEMFNILVLQYMSQETHPIQLDFRAAVYQSLID